MPPLIAILLGTVTGAGGGVVRDLFLADVPTFYRSDIYATAALLSVPRISLPECALAGRTPHAMFCRGNWLLRAAHRGRLAGLATAPAEPELAARAATSNPDASCGKIAPAPGWWNRQTRRS